MNKKRTTIYILLLFIVFCLTSCASISGKPLRTSLDSNVLKSSSQEEKDKLISLIIEGGPKTLAEAKKFSLEAKQIPELEVKSYQWIIFQISKLIYPEITQSSNLDSEITPNTTITKAFINSRNGKDNQLSTESEPIFEFFPLLSVFYVNNGHSNSVTLSAFERFSRFGLDSAIANLARGMALERSGDKKSALSSYSRAVEIASDCYPASINMARMLVELGDGEKALEILSNLDSSLTTSPDCQRIKAIAYYNIGLWEEANTLVSELLQDNPMDSNLLIIRAHLLIEKGEYKTASPLLNAYGKLYPDDKLYILLRAKIAMESSKDKVATINTLRKGLALYPTDIEIMLYAAEVLYTGEQNDKIDAINLANKIIDIEPNNLRAIKILLSEAIANSDYNKAVFYADTILKLNPNYKNFDLLYSAYKGAGKQNSAHTIAKMWYETEPSSEAGALAWLNSLLEEGKKSEAGNLISKLLLKKGSSSYRSSLYWLQSKIMNTDDSILASLRSALIENGRNLDVLLSLTDIYISKADYQRASFYLKQAIAIAPGRLDIEKKKNILLGFGVTLP